MLLLVSPTLLRIFGTISRAYTLPLTVSFGFGYWGVKNVGREKKELKGKVQKRQENKSSSS